MNQIAAQLWSLMPEYVRIERHKAIEFDIISDVLSLQLERGLSHYFTNFNT